MSHLIYSSDNTSLSCRCGAHVISAAAWNVMSEHKRLELRQEAESCVPCREDERRRFNTTRKE